MRIISTHIVPEGILAARFSDYACEVFTMLPSRKSIKKAIMRGELLLDGKVRETGAWIMPGQRIDLVDTERSKPGDFPIEIEIVYQDEYLAVINKPAGIAVNGNRYRTVENALLSNLAPSYEPDALSWPRPVHRLDRPTSGLLIVAKTAGAHVSLGLQFERRQIKKRYRAVVIGKIPDRGCIDTPIEGQEAFTEYSLVRCAPSIKNGHLSLVDLWPRTGRTHQLRKHLAGKGFPVLGDGTYGTEGHVLRSKGLFLCAVELSFIHPVNGNEMLVTIDDPLKFTTFPYREEKRWTKYNAGKVS